MATKTKTKRTKKSPATKKTVQAQQERPAQRSYSYADREQTVVAAVKSLGGGATVAELFDEVGTDVDGAFATPRRVAATVRALRGDEALLQNVGGVVSLTKRGKRVAAQRSRKTASKRNKSS